MKRRTLRDARQRARLTQDELAQIAGVTQGTISAIERGDNPNPTRETMERLASALGLDPFHIIYDSQPVPEQAN